MTMICTRVSVTHTHTHTHVNDMYVQHMHLQRSKMTFPRNARGAGTPRREHLTANDLHTAEVLACFLTSFCSFEEERCSSRSRGEGSTASDGADKSMFLRANRQQSDHISVTAQTCKEAGQSSRLDSLWGEDEARAGDAVRQVML